MPHGGRTNERIGLLTMSGSSPNRRCVRRREADGDRAIGAEGAVPSRLRSPVGRKNGRGLPNQLLAVHPLEPALRCPGAAVRRLNSLPEHAARCGEDKRRRCKKGVSNQKPDEVRSGLRTPEHICLERHVHRPEHSKRTVYCHISTIFLMRISTVECGVSPVHVSIERGTGSGSTASERRFSERSLPKMPQYQRDERGSVLLWIDLYDDDHWVKEVLPVVGIG